MRGWVLAGIVALVALSAAAAGQGAAREDEVSETLELAMQPPPGVSTSSTLGCNNPQVYGIAEPGEGPPQTQKAYTSRSSAALGCPTLFRGPSPGAFNVTGDTTAHLFVGCDEPTLMHEPLNNLRVWLVKNDEAISEALSSFPTTCSPGSPMEIEVSIEQPDQNHFNASDTIGIDATPFGSPNFFVDNLHFLVGGNETASTATVPGLAEAFEVPTDAEDAVQEVDETNETNTSIGSTSAAQDEGQNGTPGFGVLATLAAATLVATYASRRR